MLTFEELQAKLEPYHDVEVIWLDDKGYLCWRVGTGNNIEALFIEVAEQGKGYGVALYRRLVEDVERYGLKPYHSIYGFRLADNERAERFYTKLGWEQAYIGRSIYGGDGTVVMWCKWETFKHRLAKLAEVTEKGKQS